MRCLYARYCAADAIVARRIGSESWGYWAGVCPRHARGKKVTPIEQAPLRHVVYLYCFGGTVAGHAGHYLGQTDNLAARHVTHLSGSGSRLMRAAVERGLTPRIVRVWRGGRADERMFKRSKHLDRLCPECRPRTRQERQTKRVGTRRYGAQYTVPTECAHRRRNKRCKRCAAKHDPRGIDIRPIEVIGTTMPRLGRGG